RESAQSTIIFDENDQAASTLSTEERINVPLSQVSPHFLQALIAVEDQRFYSHGAIDPPRIASAAFANVMRRRAAQGASTLTQQLPDTAEDGPAQAAGGHPRVPHRAAIHQRPDPRTLCEQGVLWQRAVWRRSGLARVLRKARLRAVLGRSRNAGGPRPVA